MIIDVLNTIQILPPIGLSRGYSGAGECGIGEAFQVFNASSYGGDPFQPLSLIYNDWNNQVPGGGGGLVWGVRSSLGGTAWTTWYMNAQPAYSAPGGDFDSIGVPNASLGILAFADLMLSSTLDGSMAGNPSLAIAEGCNGTYGNGTGVGFLPNPIPPVSTSVVDGVAVFGPLESVDNNGGPRMFRPTMARNKYGYVEPIVNPDDRKWETYVYYNPVSLGTTTCNSYLSWNNINNVQKYSVSRIVITEQ